MNAIAERQMMPWVLTVYDELVRPVDDRLVAVTRQVPHHNLVAFSDLLAADLPILQRRAAHMGQRCLPADDLWHHARDEPRIVIQFQIRVRVLFQCQDTTADRVEFARAPVCTPVTNAQRGCRLSLYIKYHRS